MRISLNRVGGGVLPLSVFGLLPLLTATTARAQIVGTTPPPAVVAPSPATAPLISARQIAQGVRLLQTFRPDGSPGGPLLVTVVEADPKVRGVKVEAALGQDRVWGTDPSRGRETVSSIVGRHGAVAGINACFFPFTGVPIGLHVQGGELVTEPDQARSVFWIDRDGAAHFDVVTGGGSVRTASGAELALSGLNRPAGAKDDLLLYTPRYFSATPAAPGRFDVALRIAHGDARLPSNRDVPATVLRTAEGGGVPLSPDTVVLSGGGAGADYLRRAVAAGNDARLTLRLNLQTASGRPFDLSQVREAVTGGPRLLTGGAATVRNQEEGFGKAFSTTHHPRSAVGVTADGKVLLVTVDGRQKGISGGIALDDFALLLRNLGCVDAMNLDGGGSTTLAVGGAVVNSPSEGAERPDASMLLVYAPPLTKGGPSVAWQGIPSAHVGAAISLPAPSPATAVWGEKGGVGWVSQADGVFHATRPGNGSVALVVPGSKSASTLFPVHISGASTLDAAGFHPTLTFSAPDASGHTTLTIHLANAEGDPLANEAVAVAVTGGKPDAATVTTDAKGTAIAGITWDTNPPGAGAAVTVTSPAGRFAAATGKP